MRLWKILVRIALLALLASTSMWNSALAQSPLQGDFIGSLGPLTLKLHIATAPDGSLRGTLDSPNQGANGIPCSDFQLEGQTLSFKVPAVNGIWRGTIEKDGAVLSGTWSQGTPMPLVFTRDTFVPASTPSRVDGIWLGTSQTQGRTVRTQLIVRSDVKGQQVCSVDSPDFNAFGIACANVAYSGENFSFELPSVGGRWSGTLSSDGQSLTGSWTQKNPADGSLSPATTLDFARQTQPITALTPPPQQPAIAPVSAVDMETVLRRDLEVTLRGGLLSSGKPTGVVVGVVRNGERRTLALGTAKTDSLFEIGSITKTFTGLVMAQMIEQGKVQPQTPVRELLPKDIVAKPQQGVEITLLDLVTQHSGLPRLPDNFKPANPEDPYADYRTEQLYQFLGKHGVGRPEKSGFLYSNLGFGLLGHALALSAGTDYESLLNRAVLDPLALSDTAIALSADQQRRFIPAFTADLRPTNPWDIAGLAGAGAIRSTAGDMLKYLEAQLHPGKLGTNPSSNIEARTLPAALARSHELSADVSPNMRIAYGWLYDANTGNYWHNGGTGGFSSYAFFNPKENYAAIVLVNVALSGRGSFADQLGQHISQRFAGKPAVSLESW